MLPEPDVCERARLSRDPRFDGRFFVGVITTGIYCRPVCPARLPARENVRFFPSAAAAQDAGFRPCLRCRPENAARLPEWCISSRSVLRGLRLIDSGLLDRVQAPQLAHRLGMSQRHMNRLFSQELGATPKSLAQTRRRQLAKRLIDDSDAPLAQIALQAGYGSVRRFNDEMLKVYGRSPRALRAAGRGRRPAASGSLQFRLPFRLPYNAQWVFAFLRRRALPGLEEVGAGSYRRRITDRRGQPHWITVTAEEETLVLSVPADPAIDLADVIARVRRVFDLDADSSVVDAHLARDPRLAEVVGACPGLRVPGAWDGFETAVRAVLGQQVSVDRATSLGRRLMETYGDGRFPSAAALSRATPAEIGMPGLRGQAISSLAAMVAQGDLILDDGADVNVLQDSLCAIRGIGPWTAAYVAMRIAKDPDAFPHGDWVVLKVLGTTAGEARRLSSAWQPWRAYAVMYLWKLSERCRAAA
jgi:AraC family transcriptional regulator of adaptative response / DNA-3-methyladenine glycosylase II